MLYLIGLFGDSYYGLAEQLSGVRCFTHSFLVSDHTRNGIFFAPLFFRAGRDIGANGERGCRCACRDFASAFR